MDKHKTATHDSSETSDVPQPNESDSTCPVCKKSFKSARIKDLHFKFNKKCNPSRNMQKEKSTLGKSNIPKMKHQKEIKKTPQPEILLTPQLPVTANKNTDQEDKYLVAEGQEIEAFYQKSSPSKEKGIFSKCKTRTFLNFCEIAFDESPLLWIFSDKNRNNENQIRPQTNVLFGISDEQVDDWLASFDDENDDPVLTDKDNCKKNSNEMASAESNFYFF